MNQQRQLLRTDRNPGGYTILGMVFTWLPGLLWYKSFNKIIEHSEIKKVNVLVALIFFLHPIIAKRMNQELERRGLEYRISKFYTKSIPLPIIIIFCVLGGGFIMIPLFWQMTMALNYLSADYNVNG